MSYEKNPPADLQKTWQEFIGDYFSEKVILDVGSGSGKSKSRLKRSDNKVYTHDINRAMMDNVDFICPVSKINNIGFDIVTAFDVIEHVCYSAKDFIKELYRLSIEYVFITTPNHLEVPRNWHYKAEEFWDIFSCVFFREVKFFLRFKDSKCDYIKEFSREEFFTLSSYGLGILGRK